MVANILPADPHPRTKGQHSFFQDMVNIQLFQNMVMLHIKIKWNLECDNHSSNHFAHRAPPDPGASTYPVLTYTLDPCGGVKGQNIFSESSYDAYQIENGE